MNTQGYGTLLHKTEARAFFILAASGKRLAIFPYGKGEDDVDVHAAFRAACVCYGALCVKGRGRYYMLPDFETDEQPRCYVVYDSFRHKEEAYYETPSAAQAAVERMNEDEREFCAML